MRFQRTHGVNTLILHRFENLSLPFSQPVVGGQGFRVFKKAPAQWLAEAQIEEQLVERINGRIGVLVELVAAAMELEGRIGLWSGRRRLLIGDKAHHRMTVV